MKVLFFSTLVALGLSAQQATTYTKSAVDLNGRPVVEGPQIVENKGPNGAEITEKTRSINGREVPLERIEERVLRNDATGKVIERLIRRYDPTGNRMMPVKEIIEEQKRPDGGSTIQTTTYEGDINGRLQISSRSISDLQKSGSSETAETVLERPTINGSMDAVSKETAIKIKQSNGYQESITTYRKNNSGDFYPAVKIAKEHSESDGQAIDNSAEYEIGARGELRLHGQKVEKTVKRPDGSEDVQVEIFGQNVAGRAGSVESNALKLQEQDIIERRRVGPNAVVETLSLRRTSIADSNTLGPLQEVSQTTCRGKCESK